MAGLPRAEQVKVLQEAKGLSDRQARRAYAQYFEGEVASTSLPSKNTEIKGDKMDVEVSGPDIQTIEDVIKVCQVDDKAWQAHSFSVGQRPNGALSWRASFKKAKDGNKQIIEDFKEDMQNYSPEPMKIKHTLSPDGKLLEIALMDLHLGKLGHADECGSNYDMKIARKIFFEAINELVVKAQRQGTINRILLPAGNDYLTIDSLKNETTAGTPQDVDSRFPKIYREGRKMLVEAIEMLRQIAPVDVVIIAGNHDQESMFHIGDALECWFHAYDDVKIDNQPISRKYYQYGANMLCYSHGHQEKTNDLPGLAALEEPKMWAATKYRFWRRGHWHHETVKEHLGMDIRTLPSLSGSDKYHHSNGYVGAKRVGQAFLINEKTGVEAVFSSTPVES